MDRTQVENFTFHLFLIRKERGLSQAELAKLAGINQSTVALYENQTYTHQTEEIMRKIAKALKVSYADMIRTPSDSLLPLKRVKNERSAIVKSIVELYEQVDKASLKDQLKLIAEILKKINTLRSITFREIDIIKEEL